MTTNRQKVLGVRYNDCISRYEIDTENGYLCYRSIEWVDKNNLKEGDFMTVLEGEKIK
jgi:hypothetical protein